jgi:Flp pilus assembly protein CpaB
MTQKLSISNVLKGEASIALRLAASTGIGDFILEGDALLVILTVN